ncbi:MAG TPA: oligopeptide/dipeptide ABC transporter ATP-binding protein, partial [Desulfobacteraceae bacterium]|nr:oligopeptide/dipeptide ABC transporter ATP-binding protein [Desulfobacteraceae bacterium]
MTGDVILAVKDLVTTFDVEAGTIRAVDGAGFVLERGTTLGIVGESGCGKSVTALSIMGLLPKPSGRVASGVVAFNRDNLLTFSPGEMHRIRGKKIAMIFQEPMTALNPVHKIGKQVREVFFLHFPKMGKKAVYRACVDMLAKVGIADPGEVVHNYPHQLSGGMRQRVMIAMALAPEPDILIADEPTTALDVTVQAQILDLVKALKAEVSMSVILITHDLGVIAENCDRAVVMYAGKVVETADVDDLFSFPRHPYTRGLLTAIPLSGGKPKTRLATIPGMVPSLENMPAGCRFFARCCFAQEICSRVSPEEQSAGPRHTAACHFFKELDKALPKQGNEGLTPSTTGETIVEVKHLKKYFPVHGGIVLRQRGWVYAVDDVSFEIKKGETLGLVGESGCGKTTLGRCLLGLYPATSGEVLFNGTDLGTLKGDPLKQLRLKMQMIFQ